MNYGSVCSGIEAATVAWHPLGWRPVWFSEIEAFPSRVLAYHYPDVPNLGDMTKLNNNHIYNESIIDLLVGGTPCQSFSLAGLRGGLADDRGNLALEFCRILRAKRPRWVVWENVPGVLSSYSDESGGPPLSGEGPGNGQRCTETADFAAILMGFQECGYSVAWRVLDSQYFGFPSSVVACSLLDILEMTGDHLRRYCLSPTACAGILRRAARRGKTLPERLKQVLEEVAVRASTPKI